MTRSELLYSSVTPPPASERLEAAGAQALALVKRALPGLKAAGQSDSSVSREIACSHSRSGAHGWLQFIIGGQCEITLLHDKIVSLSWCPDPSRPDEISLGWRGDLLIGLEVLGRSLTLFDEPSTRLGQTKYRPVRRLGWTDAAGDWREVEDASEAQILRLVDQLRAQSPALQSLLQSFCPPEPVVAPARPSPGRVAKIVNARRRQLPVNPPPSNWPEHSAVA
ncbi:MAG TPA: hypothetical protein VLI05_02570 [Candidatus Saccharimonadia bacterium]|nr:hypothetical protein [Candidatus Saccharimonadia bacterium]